MEQKNVNTINAYGGKEKQYTLQNFVSKLSKKEPLTFGNYYVNFNEMFSNEDEYKDYLKKHVSLFNDDLVNKPKIEVELTSYLKPSYLTKFLDETLFYIFYYLTRDSLQLAAAEQLCKNGWKYHSVYQIWFKQAKDSSNQDIMQYFNPLEWKINDYIFGEIDPKCFLDEEKIKKYTKQMDSDNNKKDKKKQNPKQGNNAGNNNQGNNASTNNA